MKRNRIRKVMKYTRRRYDSDRQRERDRNSPSAWDDFVAWWNGYKSRSDDEK